MVPYPGRTVLDKSKNQEVRSFVYEDRNITCADCGQEFVFTASEQAFYAEKGFTDAPKRCKPCRQARKAQRNSGSGYGDDSYGGGSSYGGGGGGPFQATLA